MNNDLDFQYNLQQSGCLNPRVHAGEDGVYIKICSVLTCEMLVCAQVNCIREHYAKAHRTNKKEYCLPWDDTKPLSARRRLF